MRGKEITQDVVQRPHGITPAYAGKSVYSAFQRGSGYGSPPPMRGKAVACTRVGTV